MKLEQLNIRKLRKRSILAIRNLLKEYRINYSIADDKEKLVLKIQEIQHYVRKIKIYQRYDVTF